MTTQAFTSILVANRGEIACRILRTARQMGLETVAVYSQADANALHVKLADQAVLLGPSPAGKSYLLGDKIIAAALANGAGAIHPGYGFLSESADFATACAEAGLVFIGPSPNAIDLMGDKAKAKRRMLKAGVPCVPGYQGEDQRDDTLVEQAQIIGFPLMVKAAAGGGGRGMRLVSRVEDLSDAIKDARAEAQNAFGSDVLILERAVQRPRHVEIQVFADQYGHTIHFGERDCSVQRRHQKVLEEAPCPVMTPTLRAAMGEAAVKAAQDIDYVGAGTVEFMLDPVGNFFFLEMNTRLQVEHPVSEMITGLDLVALQIQIAAGEPLGLQQKDIVLNGHAIEARLYAEDPAQGFLPATGAIDLWKPANAPGIRIDAGIETGGEVSPFYDPIMAKIIAHGATREEARLKLIAALQDTALMGLKTNKGFLIEALTRPVFIDGQANTGFIADNFTAADLKPPALSAIEAAMAALIQYELSRAESRAQAIHVDMELLNWASASAIATPFLYHYLDEDIRVDITPLGGARYTVCINDQGFEVERISWAENAAIFVVNGRRVKALFNPPNPATLQFSVGGKDFALVNQVCTFTNAQEETGAGSVLAPMHGTVQSVLAAQGQSVTKGHRLAILEAMKMQHEILAQVDGVVTGVHCQAGRQIAADTLMFEIEPGLSDA